MMPPQKGWHNHSMCHWLPKALPKALSIGPVECGPGGTKTRARWGIRFGTTGRLGTHMKTLGLQSYLRFEGGTGSPGARRVQPY